MALAEIGIDLATGRLRGATLVSFARRPQAMAHGLLAALPLAEGLPVLAVGGFDADAPLPRITVPGEIELLRGELAAIVRIGRGTPDRAIRCRDALFLLARDALWGFGADRLSPEDIAPVAS